MLFDAGSIYNSVGNHVRAFSIWRTRNGCSNISQCVKATG